MDTDTTGGFDVLKRQTRVCGVPTTDPSIDTITDQDAAHCGEYAGREPSGDYPYWENQRRSEVALEIVSSICDEAAMRGLIDDWLVPMIVDKIIKELR
jgi:hypothetical protein